MPFLRGTEGFSVKTKKGKDKKRQKKQNNKKTNREGLGPTEGPPHLTLKPSKKTKKTKKKKRGKKQQEHQNILKMSFSAINQISILGGCPKFPFF